MTMIITITIYSNQNYDKAIAIAKKKQSELLTTTIISLTKIIKTIK